MKYSITIVSKARKHLENIPSPYYETIKEKIWELADNPKPVGGGLESHRIRIGDYRVVYSIDESDKTVVILDIDHRKNISMPDHNTIHGLSSEAAQQKLKMEGKNVLPGPAKSDFFSIALAVVSEPMFLLLLGCGTIYFLLGDFKESIIILNIVFVVFIITFYQERKTEKALDALRDLSSPRALVLRDGIRKRIAGSEVVTDDVLLLGEGDRIAADAEILKASNLHIDESLLTGESVAVKKNSNENRRDETTKVFSGTMIVKGEGIARVTATGIHTELGKIGKILQQAETEKTRLQKEINQFVKIFALVGFFVCLLVTILYTLNHGKFLDGLLVGLTLAMSALPEEFPMILTVFFALGAWRISKQNVLTRRLPAIETLGAATVLCVDKTGTLTQNKMSINEIYTVGKEIFYPENSENPKDSLIETLKSGILSCSKNPFDPMETAFLEAGQKFNVLSLDDWELEKEYHLSEELLSVTRIWRNSKTDEIAIAAKGAPEAIWDLCHFSLEEKKSLSLISNQMAARGLRILGVARGLLDFANLPEKQHDIHYKFLGLVGLADPIRSDVPASIIECQEAGIRTIMITGDYPETAKAIGKKIGLKTELIVTGSELENMTAEEVSNKVNITDIFARTTPRHKLILVKALRKNGEIVAMTGDGVNDAPALKSADIGIAMGGRGTDVARESASLILLNDDFISIVSSIRIGRRIYENLKKASAYTFSVHIPIIGITLLALFFDQPMILMPVHIAFMELIIDPTGSIIFEMEKEDNDIMKRKPRRLNERLFNPRILTISALQGLISFFAVALAWIWAQNNQMDEQQVRAFTFSTLVIANLSLIFTNRSWKHSFIKILTIPNISSYIITGITLLFIALIIYIPTLSDIFRFKSFPPENLLISFALGVGSILWFEIYKLLSKKIL